jgi:hypothetical protein
VVIFQSRYIQAAQQLNRLWSGALGQRSGPVEVIRAELDELAEQVGVDLSLAQQLTPESLELLVAPAGTTDPLRCWLLAEMFYLSGRLYEREDDGRGARESDLRALRLFERVVDEPLPELELADPRERIAALRSARSG